MSSALALSSLLISTGLTILLVLAPLALSRRRSLLENRAVKWRVILHFIMIGFACILVELGMMQKLDLRRPTEQRSR